MMMLVMKNKRELCEFAFVVAITVILKKKRRRRRNLIKTYAHTHTKKEQTTIATTACNMSVKTLIKY
jgi:hypothetical protein